MARGVLAPGRGTYIAPIRIRRRKSGRDVKNTEPANSTQAANRLPADKMGFFTMGSRFLVPSFVKGGVRQAAAPPPFDFAATVF